MWAEETSFFQDNVAMICEAKFNYTARNLDLTGGLLQADNPSRAPKTDSLNLTLMPLCLQNLELAMKKPGLRATPTGTWLQLLFLISTCYPHIAMFCASSVAHLCSMGVVQRDCTE